MSGENQEGVMTSEELAAENTRLTQELRGAITQVEKLKAEISSASSEHDREVTGSKEHIDELTYAEKSDEEARFLFDIPGIIHIELQGEALFLFFQSFAGKGS